jgi:hypothetical protein
MERPASRRAISSVTDERKTTDARFVRRAFAAPLAVVSYVLVKPLYVIETLDTATPIPGEGKDQTSSKA